MRIAIDYDKCIGIGSCEALVPSVFEIDDSGQAQVLAPELTADLGDLVRQAVGACPTAAISISDGADR